jgi:Predicted ATPases
MISHIHIRNFRSIEKADIQANWITTFVGANDAGKSNILRALNLFFNGQTDPGTPFDFERDFNRFAAQRRNKANEVEVTLTFQLPEGYLREGRPKQVIWRKIWRAYGPVTDMEERNYADGQLFSARSKIGFLLDRYRFQYVPAIKDKKFFADLQGKMYEVVATVADQTLRASALDFEGKIQEHMEELLVSVNQTFQTENAMRLPENLRQIFENLEFREEDIPLSRRGDGIKIRHIPMMLKFMAEKENSLLGRGAVRYTHIWGFEEPENNVEMSSCFEMARQITNTVAESDGRYQLLLSTHSPVFYGLPEPSDDPVGDPWLTVHFVQKHDRRTAVIQKKREEVDQAMGLMPLVTPYIVEAREKLEKFERDLEDAREIAERRRPTLFVEGASDAAVISKLTAILSPEALAGIHIHPGGDGEYGSANALSSRALAWGLEMRHRPKTMRMRALALFDADEEGKRAKRELSNELQRLRLDNSDLVKAMCLIEPPRLRALKTNFRIPADLEAFYSDSLWDLAEQRGWLVPVADLTNRIAPEINNRLIIEGGGSPFEGLGNIDRLRIQKTFSTEGKRLISQHISRMPPDQAEEALVDLKPVINRILANLVPERAVRVVAV